MKSINIVHKLYRASTVILHLHCGPNLGSLTNPIACVKEKIALTCEGSPDFTMWDEAIGWTVQMSCKMGVSVGATNDVIEMSYLVFLMMETIDLSFSDITTPESTQ